jgi:hypothetical protein
MGPPNADLGGLYETFPNSAGGAGDTPMSAAEPATPNPRALTTPDGAAVIDISKRHTTRRAAATARGRWNVTSPHQPSSDELGNLSPQQAIAEDMEVGFHAIGRTLTDDETARVFTHTLGIVQQALGGATEHGIISEEQRSQLNVWLEGMRAAPGLL